jgi:broad specificity phosphatase PhoE
MFLDCRNTALLVNLFILMLPAGMPELTSKEDINYLRDKLAPAETDEETVKKFAEQVKNALGDVRKRLDNTVHIFVHSK